MHMTGPGQCINRVNVGSRKLRASGVLTIIILKELLGHTHKVSRGISVCSKTLLYIFLRIV